MYVEVVIAIEAHEIMPVALMVAEEQVLAVHASVVLPPLLGLLDDLSLGMVVGRIKDLADNLRHSGSFHRLHVLTLIEQVHIE